MEEEIFRRKNLIQFLFSALRSCDPGEERGNNDKNNRECRGGQRDASRLWSRIHSIHKNENSGHIASADSYVLWERWTFTSEYGHREGITFPIAVEIQFTKGQRDRGVLIEMKGDSKSLESFDDRSNYEFSKFLFIRCFKLLNWQKLYLQILYVRFFI